MLLINHIIIEGELKYFHVTINYFHVYFFVSIRQAKIKIGSNSF